MRDFGSVGHAAAEESYFAAVLMREIQNLLKAMNGGAEAGNDQAARRAHEQILEAWPHGAFALGVAGTIDVGRIRQQQQYAALAVLGKGVQVEQEVISGCGVDFEIAGMDRAAILPRETFSSTAASRMGSRRPGTLRRR